MADDPVAPPTQGRKSSKFYLFRLKSGKRKLTYGRTPEEALQILGYRLSRVEMAEILPDDPQRITQQQIQEHLGELG
jgi:hypothetical protein